jgi:uncharacterized protein (DUF608 family)
MIQSKYTRDDLFGLGPQRVYRDQYLNEISFPLGGIGTGSIGLLGRGSLRDFEIFNRPNVGSVFPKTFALIRVKVEGQEPACRVLEGPISRPYTPVDGGKFHANGEGYPHMDECTFRGEYPFAWIDFTCYNLPVKVQLEAYNPFIPSEADASGIPAAILRYSVTNTGEAPVDISIAWSLLNLVGHTPEDVQQFRLNGNHQPGGKYYNEIQEGPHVKGIFFGNKGLLENDPRYGSVALSTPDPESATFARHWSQQVWFLPQYELWNSFKQTGTAVETKPRAVNHADAGIVAITKQVMPGETETFTFFITWFFPTFEKYWGSVPREQERPRWKNYYASLFSDAFDVATKLGAQEADLHAETKKFHDALFGSTLPPHVLDAISANMAILKTTTCLRLDDGTFYGWEGCDSTAGCCEGSCTHVWGYQQALPFLFPSLERSMHDANYRYNVVYSDIGALEFRIQLPLGAPHGLSKPCADGQMGGIMHVYREWKLSGNDEWLREQWPRVKMALEFAFEDWDEEKTGVLKNWQHNTYDVDFYGPIMMLTGYYLGALEAGAEMARFMGEIEAAEEYMRIHESGCHWADKNLWDEEFYVQRLDLQIAKEFQVGRGCLVDQLVGLELAHVAGLPGFLDHDHVVTALRSIFKYNWKPNMKEHENGARLYAVNDEAATIICTWPHGDRPEIMFPYADEVMNGFEYQFAVHCIYEGLLEQGLTVVKSIRGRYDGWGRNPWDEFECGHHYARSMASYGLLIALSGFEFDKGEGFVGFDPVMNQDGFQCFWSMDAVWGTYTQTPTEAILAVEHGLITLSRVKIGQFAGATNLNVTGNGIDIITDADDHGNIVLGVPVVLEHGDSLHVIASD